MFLKLENENLVPGGVIIKFPFSELISLHHTIFKISKFVSIKFYILVPVFNTSQNLSKCLEVLFVNRSFIIIIDNNNVDNT